MPEEIEFKKDKAQLEKDLFRLEVIENIIKSEKEANEETLDSLQKSFDESKEALRNCRKLYKKYAKETKLLEEEQQRRKTSKLLAGKLKAHVVLTNMVITSYVKWTETIKARNNPYLLVQALNEWGNLYYANNQLDQAEIYWKDAVNVISTGKVLFNNEF